MTTIKGFIRSYGAAVRRAEREQQRSTRAAAKRYKEQMKQEEIADAAATVANYKGYVYLIQSLHKKCTEKIDWKQIRENPIPPTPQKELYYEAKAQENLNKYRPSIFDKIFGASNKKLNNLVRLVEEGKKKDEKAFLLAQKEYIEELDDWRLLHDISQGVQQENPKFYIEALQYFNPFSDIGELGNRVEIFISDNLFDIDLNINSEQVIPNVELTQTARGKLSKKRMPKSRFNELYQDHICSSVIRVAREIFAYLPLKNIRINAIGKVLNNATGHLEKRPILSVIIFRETISTLNLEKIDPSDSMLNFVHNMNFSKIKGFAPIEKVELTSSQYLSKNH